MKVLALLLTLVGAAFGAITTSPAAISLSMRGTLVGAPGKATLWPKKSTITVSGTGSWTAVIGGDLSTLCSGPCFAATPSSGSGAATVVLSWALSGSTVIAIGEHTGTVTIEGNVTTITLTVETPLSYPTFIYRQGYPVGCSASSAYVNYADECTIEDEKPESEDFTIPAQGSSYVDTEFGHTVTRITPEGWYVIYSSVTAFNANSTKLFVTTGWGNKKIYTTAGVFSYDAQVWAYVWDAFDSNVYWGVTNDHEIWKEDISTSTQTKAADYGGTFTTISNGGNADITSDNWWAFFAPTEQQICAVNLNGLTPANQASKTYCASYASLTPALTYIGDPFFSEVDAVSGKRYVGLSASPGAVIWSVNTGTGVLDFERFVGEIPETAANDDDGICEAGETCYDGGHSAMGRDTDGNVVYLTFQDYGNYRTFVVSFQLNKGTATMRPVEEGGGLRLWLDTSRPLEHHFGCSGSYCVISMTGATYGGTGVIAVKTITDASQEKPAKITVSGTHSWVNGDKVIIDKVVGNTCVNHIWTITKVNDTQFTLDGSDCTGAGAYVSGGLAASGETADPAPFRSENLVLHLDNAAPEAYRINSHRTILYNTNSGSYYNQPHASISRDRKYIAYTSNMGTLGDAGQSEDRLKTGTMAFIAETGLEVKGRVTGGSPKFSGGVILR